MKRKRIPECPIEDLLRRLKKNSSLRLRISLAVSRVLVAVCRASSLRLRVSLAVFKASRLSFSSLIQFSLAGSWLILASTSVTLALASRTSTSASATLASALATLALASRASTSASATLALASRISSFINISYK